VHATARPLLARGRLVTVDGHPVCAECGRAVAPDDSGQPVMAACAPRWEHVPAGRPFPRRSRWFAPVTWAGLRELGTFAEFTERFPWTVTPELCRGAVTSEADWREGVRRLGAYHGLLAAARRRHVLRAGENPYLALVRVLAGGAAAAGRPGSAGGAAAAGPPGSAGTPAAAPASAESSAAERDLVWSVPGGLGNVLDLPARRRELAALFSWAIPDDGVLAVLAACGPLLECGAGTGYWAALLGARGVDVVASDVAPPGRGARRPWTEVKAASAVDAVRANRASGRTLFLCWPPFDDDGASYAAVRAYRGDVLAYAGGGAGGPTGTVRFHRELALNWRPAEQVALPNWAGLRDRLIVYRRNAVRRPLLERDRCTGCRRFRPAGAAGRCDACFARRPPAMALLINGQRVEYPAEVVEAMPSGLRLAFARSPSLIKPPPRGRPPSGEE
jgi:hypothetical protein